MWGCRFKLGPLEEQLERGMDPLFVFRATDGRAGFTPRSTAASTPRLKRNGPMAQREEGHPAMIG